MGTHNLSPDRYVLGLVLDHHKLVYGVGRKYFGAGWMPQPVQHAIVSVWNYVACKVYGHDDVLWHIREDTGYPSPRCCSCMAVLTKCVGPKEGSV